jgi:16S rRNA (adenine1518-N6/adenine1519-N6)-dimethyltransferase
MDNSRKNRGTVRPKKSLGQHFLHDQHIAQRIVDSLVLEKPTDVLEIGPGTGVLTKHLIKNYQDKLKVVEIDRDSVAYLKEHYPGLDILEGDFLTMDMNMIFSNHFSIIGNFPYNISSQIFFKVLEHVDQVDQIVCMLQKEVADRIASSHGNKTYGILSVLLQTYYDIKILFKVSPGVFIPPPKVMSAVIQLKGNKRGAIPCDKKLFVQVVKQGFNNRRKTLRNALKNLNLAAEISALPLLDKRAEQLKVDDFLHLTLLIQQQRGDSDI